MRKKSLALILTLGLLLSSFALLIPVSAEQEPEYGEISKTYDGWIEYLGTVQRLFCQRRQRRFP